MIQELKQLADQIQGEIDSQDMKFGMGKYKQEGGGKKQESTTLTSSSHLKSEVKKKKKQDKQVFLNELYQQA